MKVRSTNSLEFRLKEVEVNVDVGQRIDVKNGDVLTEYEFLGIKHE